jgi:hypothetical protein
VINPLDLVYLTPAHRWLLILLVDGLDVLLLICLPASHDGFYLLVILVDLWDAYEVFIGLCILDGSMCSCCSGCLFDGCACLWS